MKRPAVVLVSVLVVAGVGLAFTLARQRTRAREEQEDKAIIDFVYDQMVPRVAIDTVKACVLPSRDFVGVLHVKTAADGAIVFSRLEASAEPKGWTGETRACVDGKFAGYTQRPPELRVPPDREYEVDVQLTFPIAAVP